MKIKKTVYLHTWESLRNSLKFKTTYLKVYSWTPTTCTKVWCKDHESRHSIRGEIETVVNSFTNLHDYCQKVRSNFKQHNSYKTSFTAVYARVQMSTSNVVYCIVLYLPTRFFTWPIRRKKKHMLKYIMYT